MNCLSANKCNCLDRVAEARVRRREAEEAKRRTVADFHWAVVEAIAFLGVVVMFGGLTSTSIRAEGIFQDGLNSSISGLARPGARSYRLAPRLVEVESDGDQLAGQLPRG